MPIGNLAQVGRMAQLSGAEVPRWVVERMERAVHDPAMGVEIGIEIATELSMNLLDAGAPGLHVYTLNRPYAAKKLCANLDLRRP
jgi:methylenetetrahydrofolate reductase (NADPH)